MSVCHITLFSKDMSFIMPVFFFFTVFTETKRKENEIKTPSLIPPIKIRTPAHSPCKAAICVREKRKWQWQQVGDLVPLDSDEYWIGWFVKDYLHHSLPVTVLVATLCWAFVSLADFLLGCSLQISIVLENGFDSFALVCIGEFIGDEIWQKQSRKRVQKWLGIQFLNYNASTQAP